MNPSLKDLLTIQILGWNSSKQLKLLLPTLVPYADDVVIRYIDNASTDDSVALVTAAMPNADIVSLSKNTGYTNGHNIGFTRCTTPYVLVVNPDVTLNWDSVVGVLEEAKKYPAWGAIQGILLRPGTPVIVDSAGIMRTLTFNGREIDAGDEYTAKKYTQRSVDAVTGACALYSMAALRKVAYGEYEIEQTLALEVFDKDFFAYKEDVDLGWRLQQNGFHNICLPIEIGTHYRQLRSGWGHSIHTIKNRLKNRRTQLSFRNYLWMVAKNAPVGQLLLRELFVDLRLLLFFLLSLLYWPFFSVWADALHGLPNMLHKRSHEAINHNR